MSSLGNIQRYLTLYGMSSYLLLGNIGNSVNILLFSRSKHKTNSCSFYLRAASCVNLFILNFGVIPTLYSVDHTDPQIYSDIFCKLRLYFLHTALMISRTLIVLACIDRLTLCSSNPHIRTFCRRSTAARLTAGTCLAWPIISIHIPILLEIYSGRCMTTGTYGLVYSIYSVTVAGLAPPTLMVIFGMKAMRNLRRLHQRARQNNHHNVRIIKNDYYLTVMLMSEVIVYIISTLPYPVQTLYITMTSHVSKSTERLQIESFVTFLSYSFLIYINSASTFYVYIFTSPAFRRQCRKLLVRFRDRIVTSIAVHPEPIQQHSDMARHRETRF